MESFRQMPQSRLTTPSSAAAAAATGTAGARAAAAALSKPVTSLPVSKHAEQHTQVL